MPIQRTFTSAGALAAEARCGAAAAGSEEPAHTNTGPTGPAVGGRFSAREERYDQIHRDEIPHHDNGGL
jgi:hypothetical protein